MKRQSKIKCNLIQKLFKKYPSSGKRQTTAWRNMGTKWRKKSWLVWWRWGETSLFSAAYSATSTDSPASLSVGRHACKKTQHKRSRITVSSSNNDGFPQSHDNRPLLNYKHTSVLLSSLFLPNRPDSIKPHIWSHDCKMLPTYPWDFFFF